MSNNQMIVIIDNNKLIKAYFTEQKYKLFVKKIGSGLVSGGKIQCGYDCYAEFEYNENIMLSALPTNGFHFTGWVGDGTTVNGDKRQVIMDSDKTVIAVFCEESESLPPLPTTPIPTQTTTPAPTLEPEYFTLTVNKVGNGHVVSNDGSIDCGSTCVKEYILDTQVVLLEPMPDVGWVFVKWEGNGIGSTNRIIYINTDKEVTAYFEKEIYKLIVNIDGQGVVESNIGFISCGTDCQDNYEYGDEVQLTASPLSGYKFIKWENDINSTNNVETITINNNKQVTAIFDIEEYTLTIIIHGSGNVSSNDNKISCPNICEVLYCYNSTITLTALSNSHYSFERWDGDLVSTLATDSINILKNTIVHAYFIPVQYLLSVEIQGEGSIESTPSGILCNDECSEYFDYDSTVMLVATPEIGWEFEKWSDDITGDDPNSSITISGDHNVIAHFKKQELLLTINIIGEGKVETSDNIINCPELLCSNIYEYGTSIGLLAIPSTDWEFKGWSGDLTSTNLTDEVIIDSEKTITALFELKQYELVVLKEGNGIVVDNVGSIDCGSTCSGYFDYNTSVILTATPDPGYEFIGWSEDFEGNNNSTDSIIIDDNKQIKATFQILTYTLTIVTHGNGSVESLDNNILCPNTCEHIYEYGTNVSLTAVSDQFWHFDYWDGDINGNSLTNSVEITDNKTVHAYFKINSYMLKINKLGTGYGTVTSDLSGINCGDNCEHYYEYGTFVELIALPNIGSDFIEWSGDISGSASSQSILIVENRIVNAQFDINLFDLEVEIIGQGIVSSDPSGISCNPTCVKTYPYGTNVELTATPDNGNNFSHWEIDLIGNSTTKSLTIDGNKLVRANFVPIEYSLIVNIDGVGSVLSSDDNIDCPDNSCSSVYYYLDSVSLEAFPGYEYYFEKWSGDIESTSAVQNINITSNNSITAHFKINQYTLNVYKTGFGNITGDGINCGGTCDNVYDYNTTVTLTATPQIGYHFVDWDISDWDNNISSLNNSEIDILIDKNRSATANFSINIYEISINVDGFGNVKSTDGIIDCNTSCVYSYEYDSSLTLEATPDIGYYFDGWYDDLTGTELVKTINIQSSKTITAKFVRIEYLLEVTKEGDGLITSTPIGIDCATDCDNLFDYHEMVTLEAQADIGFELSHCEGDYDTIDVDNEIITVLMDEDKLLNIVFIPSYYDLQVRNLITEERGTIVSDIDNCIDCRNIYPNDFPESCNCTIPRNYNVELQAIPDQYFHLSTWEIEDVTIHKIGKGYGSIYVVRDGDDFILTPDPQPGFVFCGWTGQYDELLDNNRAKVKRYDNRTVEVCFSLDERQLIVTKVGSGQAYITSDPGGIYYGHINNYTFMLDSIVYIYVYLQNGAEIISVSGEYESFNDNIISIKMTDHKEIVIEIDQVCYDLFLENLTTTKNGDIYSAPQGIECGEICEYCMPKDEYTQLIAVPENGYYLETWEFETVKIHKSGNGFGSIYVTKDSGKLFLTPDPHPGYIFCGWTGDYNTLLDNNVAEVIIDPTHEIYACFTIPQVVLTVHKSGDGVAYIISEPSGIYYGHKNTYSFNTGTTVMITVILQEGSEILSVTGNYDEIIDNHIYITLGEEDEDLYIELNTPYYSLTIENLDTNDETDNIIYSQPQGIDCGDICQTDMPKDTSIVLQAVPEQGYHISTWELEGIIINKIGDGFGNIYTTKDESNLYLTPDPYPGFIFQGWNGDIVEINGNVATVQLGQNSIINCDFSAPLKTLKVNKINTNSGSSIIISEPTGIFYGSTNQYQFKQGSKVLLVSRLLEDTLKTLWYGDYELLEDNVIKIEMSDDITIEVDYEI